MGKRVRRVFSCIAAILLTMASFAYAERDYGEVPFLLAYPSTKQFPAEQRYPVYSGPGEHYWRGDGTAIVSTNGPIRVYGEENGWLLIEYLVSDQSDRIGYIPSSCLLPDQEIASLDFSYAPAFITKRCTLTDDPTFTQRMLCYLEVGHEVTFLGYFSSGWAYIETTTNEGELIRGCVPLRSITIYPKENERDLLLNDLHSDNDALAHYESQYLDHSYAPLPSSIAWSISNEGQLVSAYITAASKSRRIDVFDNNGNIAWSVRKGYLEGDATRATAQIIQDADGFAVLFFDDAAMIQRLQTKYTWKGKERGKDSSSSVKPEDRYTVESLTSFNVYVSGNTSADTVGMVIEHRDKGKKVELQLPSNLPYSYVEYAGRLYLLAANENGQMQLSVFGDAAKLLANKAVDVVMPEFIAAKDNELYVVVSDEQRYLIQAYDISTLAPKATIGFTLPQGWSIDAMYKGTDRILLLITDHITINAAGERIGTSRLCSVTHDGALLLVKDLDQRAVWSYQLADGKVYVISQSVLHGWPDAAFYLNRIIVQ